MCPGAGVGMQVWWQLGLEGSLVGFAADSQGLIGL